MFEDSYRRDSYRRETTAKAKTKPAFDLEWEQFVLDSAQIRNYCPIHKPHMFILVKVHTPSSLADIVSPSVCVETVPILLW